MDNHPQPPRLPFTPSFDPSQLPPPPPPEAMQYFPPPPPLPPPPPPVAVAVGPRQHYQPLQHPHGMDSMSVGQIITYSNDPDQSLIYKKGQYIPKDIQQKVVQAINVIQDIEMKAGMDICCSNPDYKKIRARRYSSSSSSRSYSRGRSSGSSSSSIEEYNHPKKASRFAQIGDQYHREERGSKKHSRPIKKSNSNSHMDDMGLLSDGRARLSAAGVVTERIGLGSTDKKGDLMNVEDFRMKMGIKFQEHNDKRNRDSAGGQRCYKCNKPGHIAKDCSYGFS
ncbi:unnamed protein product [Moneuplotes crassus]|uniref:CCHC-type domain-containing protein n=1 Tax=Euplotes crassus TaxID=5936 RepID=A0AAD1UIP1_EUPCR|nr:unnamed protein product [Moneuplotes crassus]